MNDEEFYSSRQKAPNAAALERGRRERWINLRWFIAGGCAIALWFSLVIGSVYVLWHFISKFW